MTRPRLGFLLVIVLGLALGVRLVAVQKVAIIERDGVEYLDAASRFARGDASAGLEHHYPPAYPVTVAALARALGREPDERIAQCASALAGAVLAAATAVAAGIAFGRRAGFLAGLLAAVHPASTELAALVLPDALMAALVLASLASALAALRGRPTLFVVAGALAGASYLARPEGILVLAAILGTIVLGGREGAGARRSLRARDAALLLSPALLVAIPYVAAIKKDAALNGGEAGVWKLTKKRELFLEAGGEKVFPRGPDGSRGLDAGAAVDLALETGKHAAKQLYLLALAANPVVLALAGLGVVSPRPRAPPARALLALSVATAALLLGAYSLFRADERYARVLASLLVPFAGQGLARGASLCLENGLARARMLVLVLLLAQLPFATRERNARKATWREAGETCAGLGISRIASTDPRVAFYAKGTHVDLHGPLRDLGPKETRASAILRAARAGEAGAVVLDATVRPGKPGDPLVLEISALLKPPVVVVPIERDGAESVIVIVLR